MGDLMDWNKIVSLGTGPALAHFGNPQEEFSAAAARAVVAPLTHFDLLRFHGSDAKAFLQAQLTCDVDQVTAEQARFGGYCTPKGRLLASFLLMQSPSGYLMQLPAGIAPGITERLRKFVLRSRVSIERTGELSLVGVAGPEAPVLLQEQLGTLPAARLALARQATSATVRLPGDQFLIVAASSDMAAPWERLTKRAVPVGAECWNWLQIRAGIPWITGETQDQFLPQMIGLDAIGGVSFDKGCYPGQEIVARSRYLGEVKRRLYFGHAQAPVHLADALFAGGQPCGTVLNAALAPGGGSDFLAVASAPTESNTQVQLASGESVVLTSSTVPV